MMKTKFILLTLSLTAFIACTNKPNELQAEVDVYFNLTALLDQQIEQLIAGNAQLEKFLTSGDDQETVTITPDSLGWERQLKLFYEADINKVGFTDEYFEEELPAINGTFKRIFSAKNQKHPVRVMECIYENNGLKEIRLLVEENNSIYNTSKEMNLYFEKETLIGFNIKGGEAMTLKKDLNYSIQGTVVYQSKPE